ncbi:A/G-specific adenine glycosylase [Ferruginivarius sediminum]|uniref:Adenine DNA glycosylase n=1 Tax=Ferruginivarius sediminum TaxID=2661937 RepID=A0A369T9V8_9PROT|nr:A/G-specific adenine glycosylase [Ferruginivarius sediminum]RDD61165.1 A/G-specific adenine glycosylase [Ferruginivarius sediminum]
MADNASEQTTSAISRHLLAWYDRHARSLPWRAPPGGRADPYHVWLSEVMLQQTTTATVAPYFHDFLQRWPSVHDLAAAPREEVMTAWAGLGYYARARNLHKCARMVSHDLGGRFPEDEAGLRKLPGIGPYTAAAIAAIAFDRPAAPLDGNIERVVARLFAVEDPLPGAKESLRGLMARLVPTERPGDFAQAMMDLGATVCVPKTPKCMLCPLHDACDGRALGGAGELPRKAPKKARPTRRAVAFWTVRADGSVLLRRRPPEGLLGGMLEVPTTAWTEDGWDETAALRHAPVPASWNELPGQVRHGFTHFEFLVTVWAAQVPAETAVAEAVWAGIDRLGDAGLPTAMRKIAEHAIRQGGGG